MKRLSYLILVGFILVGIVETASAIPQLINYQGYLTDDVGNPVADGDYSLTFRMWDAETGPNQLWSEDHPTVSVTSGLFNVILGSISPLELSFDTDYWLGIQVGVEPELPRMRLTSVAYSYRADVADNAVSASHAARADSATQSTYADTASWTLGGGSAAYADTAGYAFRADTAEYALSAPDTPDNDWLRTGRILHPFGEYGLSMRQSNILHGQHDSTHVNFGVACTTGTSGQDFKDCTVGGGKFNAASGRLTTVSGGFSNTAGEYCATVGGGYGNAADSAYTTIGGGYGNTASYALTTVGGGFTNTASGDRATVGGGGNNIASARYTTVGGGADNAATDLDATVGGGLENTASGIRATVSGGGNNLASGEYATVDGGATNLASGNSATVGGGVSNAASGNYATVGGGYNNDSDGDYSFTVGDGSVVPSAYSNSAAFNGQTATASGQARVGVLSKASGTFTIDHPTQPMNRVLNHYFVESPEMVLIYRGVATIGSDGRTEVHLPDYFDALTRNSMVQLTGVGTSDVYVSEKVTGNRFAIGGKPGTEVYWTVTGERKDQSAEITRILMPVEQLKEGNLAGRSLDDDFLAATMSQLERMGEAGKFEFRTAEGQEKYQRSLRALEETGPTERE